MWWFAFLREILKYLDPPAHTPFWIDLWARMEKKTHCGMAETPLAFVNFMVWKV